MGLLKVRMSLLVLIAIFLVCATVAPTRADPVRHDPDPAAPSRPDPELHLTNEFSLPPEKRVKPAKRLHDGRNPLQPNQTPGGGDRGVSITKTFITGKNGLYWSGSSLSTFTIPVYTPIGNPDAVIYAPTGRPYGQTCVEAVGIHWRPHPQTPGPTYHASGFWNHCPDAEPTGWISGAYEDMSNALWRSKYLSNDPNAGEFYAPRVRPTSTNCSVGELWNWTAGVWDIKTPIRCGTQGFLPTDWGWLMWESYGLMNDTQGNCFTIPNAWTWNVHLYDGTPAWSLFLQSYGDNTWPNYGWCWATGRYRMNWTGGTQYWQWRARTPN